MGTCPDCEENFDLDEEAQPGDILECPKCRVRLELLNVHPVAFDYAPEEDLA
ncbi:MAG TPA: lysine biosynthesis protein LysW [Candidatus Polarisedimenticolia bacterium]|nr:lysine biosynthesis protein LysW [Candidatus Polarisedimenticolia bacterium]